MYTTTCYQPISISQVELITIRNLFKSFQARNSTTVDVISNLNFFITKGEVIAIRGDNGTGKTTLINLIAGLEKPTSGKIDFVAGPIKIGLVPQDYSASLLPHMNVFDNISLPLRLLRCDRSTILKKVNDILDTLQVTLPLSSFPHELSGGQKQKVAISRALLASPDLLILDEPFSNIDFHTQIDLQKQINAIHSQGKLSIVIVSHELDSCIYLSDRILLLHGKPASVKRVFDVGLNRPRVRSQVFSSDFESIRSMILLEEELLYTQRISV